MPQDTHEMHSLELLNGFPKSYALISQGSSSDRTAAVFVHGFTGNSVTTWLQFQTLIDELQAQYPDFARWDLYFYDYRSLYGNVPVLAADVVKFLRKVYPKPNAELFTPSPLPGYDIPIKAQALNLPAHYEELILIGHSLGGVLLRQAVLEIFAQKGYDNVSLSALLPDDRQMLDGTLRLFAPAIFGFEPTHLLGFFFNFACGIPALQAVLKPFLESSPPYRDLQLKSDRLVELRRRTELLARQFPLVRALRAEILYGSEEGIVHTERFDCDPAAGIEKDRNHTSICKPTNEYQAPLRFVYGKSTSASA